MHPIPPKNPTSRIPTFGGLVVPPQERLAEQKAAEEAIRAEQRQKLKAEKAEQNARKVQEEKAEAELRAPEIGEGLKDMICDLWIYMMYD